jgi:hypothetical protein
MNDQNWLNAVRFKKFSLHNPGSYSVLPERYGLVFDRLTGTLTLVNWKQEQFIDVCSSLNEEQIALILYLLEMWPDRAPYEEMLSQVGIEPTSQQREDFARIRQGIAGEQAMYEQARERVEPLFQALWDRVSGCKDCLNNVGIDIVALMNYGWLIVGFHP